MICWCIISYIQEESDASIARTVAENEITGLIRATLWAKKQSTVPFFWSQSGSRPTLADSTHSPVFNGDDRNTHEFVEGQNLRQGGIFVWGASWGRGSEATERGRVWKGWYLVGTFQKLDYKSSVCRAFKNNFLGN